MTGQQLRNAILQEAIEGRLVLQDPSDEPASVLLERIRKEKQKLVKKGKLKKKDLEEIPISEEEKPFEIPKSWEWVRLGFIIDFSKASSIKSDYIKKTDWVLDLEDIEKDSGRLLRKKTMQDCDAKSDKHRFKKGDVLYSKLRPYLNKVIIADEDGFCTSEILAFDFGEIFNKYAQLYLMSPFFVQYAMNDAYGVKMPRLGSKQGNAACFPLPPLSEQQRIVAKVDELLPIVEEYGKAQEALDKLNKDLPEKLKKSILQEAIEGRLIPQDPKDEPASVLLDNIRKEKAKLVKEKKIKAAKNESRICRTEDGHWMEHFEDKKREDVCVDGEIPFDLPKSWEWSRLGSIISLLSGRDLSPEEYNDKKIGIPYITGASNFNNDSLIENRWTPNPVAISKKGDLLITCKGTIGTMAYNNIGDIHIARQVMAISSDFVFLQYIRFFLMNIVFKLQKNAKSMIPGISREDILQALIPLPPLAEQHRIVSKIEELMNKIEKLKEK